MPEVSIHKRGSLVAQTILFPVDRFTRRQAVAWALKNGFRVEQISLEKNYWRVRQLPYEIFQNGSWRTIPFGATGIKAIAARLAGQSRGGRFPSLVHWHNARIAQSLLIPQKKYTWRSAIKWANKQGFRTAHKVVAGPPAFIRVEILPEKMFVPESLKAVEWIAGVKMVTGRIESYRV